MLKAISILPVTSLRRQNTFLDEKGFLVDSVSASKYNSVADRDKCRVSQGFSSFAIVPLFPPIIGYLKDNKKK